MNGFGLDGKLFKGLTKAGDFIILAVITVLFCVPVITIGAALTAAFYSGIKLVRDEESYVYKDFWKSFKMNFAQGFLLELIHVVIGFLLFVDLRASAQWGFCTGLSGWCYICICCSWCYGGMGSSYAVFIFNAVKI